MKAAAAALGAILACPGAFAACDKIDYTEVRDWTPEKVEQQYCHTGKVIQIYTDERRRANQHRRRRRPVRGRVGRVLRNVHNRPTPACAAALPKP